MDDAMTIAYSLRVDVTVKVPGHREFVMQFTGLPMSEFDGGGADSCVRAALMRRGAADLPFVVTQPPRRVPLFGYAGRPK